jgi:hypothetical protein
MSDGPSELIEITPAMIDAGVVRLLRYSPEGDIDEEAVKEIFLAMLAARRLGHSSF